MYAAPKNMMESLNLSFNHLSFLKLSSCEMITAGRICCLGIAPLYVINEKYGINKEDGQMFFYIKNARRRRGQKINYCIKKGVEGYKIWEINK